MKAVEPRMTREELLKARTEVQKQLQELEDGPHRRGFPDWNALLEKLRIILQEIDEELAELDAR
jgi:hypothetical protein